jgi:hypothetical protein
VLVPLTIHKARQIKSLFLFYEVHLGFFVSVSFATTLKSISFLADPLPPRRPVKGAARAQGARCGGKAANPGQGA